jgi:hypothetical protein
MNMKRYLVCLVLVLISLFPLLGAPVPPPEKLLASDTIAVFTIPDYSKSSAVWKEWPSRRLWDDPSMKPFRDKLMKKLTSDVIEPFGREFGIQFSDYAGLAKGQVTLAFTPGSSGMDLDQPPGFLFLLDAREKSGALQTNLTNLKKKWVDSGKQIRVEKIRDVEFTTLIFKSDDLNKTVEKIFPDPNAGNETLDEDAKPKKPARKLEWMVGQSGSLLIVGTTAKDIEKVLVGQSSGSISTLSEQPSFASSYGSLFRDAQAYGWVNLKTIVDAVSRKAAQGAENQPPGGQPMMPSWGKLLSTLGLSGLQALAINVKDSGDGCLANLNINAPEATRKGLLKVFAYEAKDANPPAFVPGDAVKFSRWRLDIQKAWNTLENTLVEAMPQMAGVIKMVMESAGKDKDPNFDLRKSLIGNLGDDIVSYQKTPRKQTLMDLNSPPSITLISSPRADQLAASLKALASLLPQQGGPKVKEREFLGRKIYSFGLPPGAGPGGGKPVERTLHYTASGGYVALSTDASMLEEYLRSGESTSKALRDTPGLREAAEKVGGMGTGLFGYENQVETMRATVETLKKESGTLANLFSGSPIAGRLGINNDSNKFKEWVDFSLLPSYDKIGKYFHMNVWSGAVNSEGMSFKVFAPNPPGWKK